MRRSIVSLLPLSFKYAPGQARDDHGRFGSGSSGAGGDGAGSAGRDYLQAGLHLAMASALLSGSSTATKILSGLVVAAGGLAHLQAYIRRLMRIRDAQSGRDLARLTSTPVRRSKMAHPNDALDLEQLLSRLGSLGESEARQLLNMIVPLIPQSDAEDFIQSLRQQGILP